MPANSNDEFDVIIIGGGPVGEHAADRCRRGGLEVAIVESELVGGECSYWACMPSKTLLRPGQILAEVREVPGAREAVTGSIDAEAALARRNWMTGDWNDQGQVDWIASIGAHLVRGRGALAGERSVEVQRDGESRTIRARRAVIIATGSRASLPPIEGLEAAHPWDNRGITSAQAVPRRLLVIGGGVVGVEMAQAWRRLGSEEVTIVEVGPRVLANIEPFASELIADAFRDEGIRIISNAKILSVARAHNRGPVTIHLGDESLEGDEILVGAGRTPNTKDLGLEDIGVEPGRPVTVDQNMRALGQPDGWLYAIGDVNGRSLLTHMGKYQARIAVRSILGKDNTAGSDIPVPGVIFTDPPIGFVGFTEQAAKTAGHDVRVVNVANKSVAAGAIFGETCPGSCQLVVDTNDDVVVGATFVGPSMGEALHAATIAITGRVPMERLFHAIPSFPTLSEVWLELVESYLA